MSSESPNLTMPPGDPLEKLAQLLDSGDRGSVEAFLDQIPQGEKPRLVNLLDEERQQVLLSLLDDEDAAELLEGFYDSHAADLIEDLPAEEAARIVEEMESQRQADVLGELEDEHAEAILSEMDPDEAQEIRKLLEYDENTAGGLMATEFVQFPDDMKSGDLIEKLRSQAESFFDRGLHYVYVHSKSGTLVGVVRMRDLLFAAWDTPLSRIMIANPISVSSNTTIEALDDQFDRYPFWSLPVVDSNGRMIGVVRRADIEEALGEEHERVFLRFSGIIGGEEIRSMPLRERAMRRLAWLGLNSMLSLLAASVVLLFEGTISELFVLVFFMPVIANLSGCSGNQAVAVSIRELAVGLIQPKDFMLVWRKELMVGLINGTAIGLVLGGVALLLSVTFWHASPLIGVVIGLAFLCNTVIAVSLGGLIPLMLKRIGADAALGAPPILTTLTDMCGFLIVLTLASVAISTGLFEL